MVPETVEESLVLCLDYTEGVMTVTEDSQASETDDSVGCPKDGHSFSILLRRLGSGSGRADDSWHEKWYLQM